MIIIVESPHEVLKDVEVVTRYGPDGVTTANGRIVGRATSAEYVEHVTREQGFPERSLANHGPHYYKVAVD